MTDWREGKSVRQLVYIDLSRMLEAMGTPKFLAQMTNEGRNGWIQEKTAAVEGLARMFTHGEIGTHNYQEELTYEADKLDNHAEYLARGPWLDRELEDLPMRHGGRG